MKKLYVYADFDWLDSPKLVGELSADAVRGRETYIFSYDNDWLAKHADVFLCGDLQNFPGSQYTRQEHDIFGCFSDALPDRWGRTLLNRREQIAAADEKRPVRHLSSFDHLMGIDDGSRMGAFRFALTPGGKFIFWIWLCRHCRFHYPTWLQCGEKPRRAIPPRRILYHHRQL